MSRIAEIRAQKAFINTHSEDDDVAGDETAHSPTQSETDLDALSPTSTIRYDQEAFDTFQDKVKCLAKKLWPNALTSSLKIDRLTGGDFNRITGITLKNSSDLSEMEEKYILRTPRFVDRPLSEDLNPLRFLEQFPKIPVPKIIAFDHAKDNTLGEQYIVQQWANGKSLLETWTDLQHNERIVLAAELGMIIHELTRMNGCAIGCLVLTEDNCLCTPQFSIKALDDAAPPSKNIAYLPQGSGASFPHDASYDAMRSIFEFRIATAKAKNVTFDEDYNTKFLQVLNEIKVQGHLINMPIVFCHLDFQPRNILASMSPQTHISAVLDWDSAIFAPAVLACEPPSFLWSDWIEADDEREGENDPNEEPTTPEMQEIKRAFEDAAGPLYMRLAYGSVNRILRQLVRVALFGMNSNEELREAETMLEQWESVKSSMPQAMAALDLNF